MESRNGMINSMPFQSETSSLPLLELIIIIQSTAHHTSSVWWHITSFVRISGFQLQPIPHSSVNPKPQLIQPLCFPKKKPKTVLFQKISKFKIRSSRNNLLTGLRATFKPYFINGTRRSRIQRRSHTMLLIFEPTYIQFLINAIVPFKC